MKLNEEKAEMACIEAVVPPKEKSIKEIQIVSEYNSENGD